MDNPNNKPDSTDSNVRHFISLGITTISILGVLGLAIVILVRDTESPEQVLGTVLPVIGTWVGTILAYYFSKDNLEAATRSFTAVAQMSAAEKLKSVRATEKMIPKSQMFFRNTPGSGVNLFETLTAMDDAKKGSRLPILDDKGCPVYVIHRSTIDRYMVQKATSGSGTDLKTLTLQNMLDDDAAVKSALEKSFVTVNETATLADAKAAMDQITVCQDVFVTKAGTRNEPVLGWITNAIIEDNSKV